MTQATIKHVSELLEDPVVFSNLEEAVDDWVKKNNKRRNRK